MTELENVAWRTWNTKRAVSNLHRREPAAARTICGPKIPVHGETGEVLDDPAIVQREDWEGLLCERCFPDAAEDDRPRTSRACWHKRDRARDTAVGTDTELYEAGALEVWRDGRGSALLRLADRWQLRRSHPGVSSRYDSWELVDGARPRLRPPTTWANRVLRTGRS
jgi:hypothetical protein